MPCTSCKKQTCKGSCKKPDNSGPTYAFPLSSFIWTGEPINCNGIVVNTGDAIDIAFASLVAKVCGIDLVPGPQGVQGLQGLAGNDGADAPISKNANTVFVDSTYGDDLTGEYENPAKPFLTISAAQVALVTILTGLGIEGIIKLTGTFSNESINLESTVNINYQATSSSVILDGVSFNDGGSLCVAKLTGYPTISGSFFNSRFLTLNSGSIFYGEIQNYNKSGFLGVGGFIAASGTSAKISLTIVCNDLVRHEDLSGNFTSVFRFNGEVDYNLTFKGGVEYLGIGNLLDCRPSGAVNIQNGIINAPFFNSSDKAINIQSLNLQSKSIFNIPEIKGASNVGPGVVGVWGDFGKIQINGDIIGTSAIAVCLDTRTATANTQASKLNIKGKIINTALNCTYLVSLQTNASEVTISGYVFGDANTHLIKVLNGQTALNLVDCILYNSNAIGLGIFTTAGADIRLTNVLSEIQTINAFLEAFFPSNVMLNNVRSNQDVQALGIITDQLSPSGFIYDTNLTVPKLY